VLAVGRDAVGGHVGAISIGALLVQHLIVRD
jgi:hypothetical protein